jgi:hypothetical protein
MAIGCTSAREQVISAIASQPASWLRALTTPINSTRLTAPVILGQLRDNAQLVPARQFVPRLLTACRTPLTPRGRGPGRCRAHVIADRAEQAGQSFEVLPRKGLDEEAADDIDVARQHARDERAAGVVDGDGDAPLVVR